MNIQTIQQKTKPIFEQYDIRYAGVFGSFARDEATDTSDVDLVVRLGKPMGMFSYMRFIDELEKSLDRKVDVVTEKSINPRVKPYITADLTTIYEK